MNERKSKNIVIIALCITLIFMGVGFSALTANLEINGTATVSGEWNVQIASIEATEAVIAGATVETPATLNGTVNAEGTLASFTAALTQPGDYILYTVTVANRGNIAAELKGYTPENGDGAQAGVTEYNAIKYTFVDTANAVGTELAATTGTHTFTVKAEYDAEKVGVNAPKTEADKTRTYNLFLNYEQK